MLTTLNVEAGASAEGAAIDSTVDKLKGKITARMAVGTKVTIVSRKVQTTRTPVRGIFMSGPAQIVLIDTPGIFAPRRRLDRAMVGAAWSGAHDADAIVFLIDAARGLDDEARAILNELKGVRPPVYVALNKVDRLAEKVGIKFQQIQKYETGMNRISASRLWDISEALEVPVGFFFEGLGEASEASSAADLPADILADKEALELLRSYYAIPENQRRRLFDLARVLSEAA